MPSSHAIAHQDLGRASTVITRYASPTSVVTFPLPSHSVHGLPSMQPVPLHCRHVFSPDWRVPTGTVSLAFDARD